MTTEVFAHLSGRNLRFLAGVGWQDSASELSRIIYSFASGIGDARTKNPAGLLGDLCQSVTKGVNDQLEAVGNVEF